MAAPYVVNTRVKFSAEFRDTSGALFDPDDDTLEFRLRKPLPRPTRPGEVEVLTYTYPDDAEIVRASTGLYSITLLLDVVGEYRYRWSCAETNQEAAEERSIVVKGSVVV